MKKKEIEKEIKDLEQNFVHLKSFI